MDNKLSELKSKKFLTGASLKWFALITMLIDHIGAVILLPYLYKEGINFSLLPWEGASHWLAFLYSSLRLIGRLSFPIFCFLLVEGMNFTKNKNRYLITLFAFALISELPFNYAVTGDFLYFGAQNIFFTLFLSALSIYIVEELKNKKIINNVLVDLMVYFIVGMIAEYLNTDYGFYGVFLVAIIYVNQNSRLLKMLTMFLAGIYQYSGCLSSVLCYFYNGKRGKQNKYFFYIFYPAHLILLSLIRHLII